MERHKYLKENGVEFEMSTADIISADTNDIIAADRIRIGNVQRGFR